MSSKYILFFIIQQIIRYFFHVSLELSYYQLFIGLFLYPISRLSSPEQDTDRLPEKLLIKRSFNDANILLKTANNGG
jgi:hypothetical protein